MYGEDWEKLLQAKELEADFYYLIVLFNYYKRVYYNLFSDEGPLGSLSVFPRGVERWCRGRRMQIVDHSQWSVVRDTAQASPLCFSR